MKIVHAMILMLLAGCSSSSGAASATDGGADGDAVDPCVAALAKCPTDFSAAQTPTSASCPPGGDTLVTTSQCHGYQLLKHTEGTTVVWFCFYDKTTGAFLGASDASGTGQFHEACVPPGSLFTSPVGKVGDFEPCAYASLCPTDAGVDAGSD